MSVQMCEGIWRNRTGQRVVITRCEPVGGQQWTDGVEFYSDDGTYDVILGEGDQDLVSFVGLLPESSQPDQTVKIDLLRTTLTQQTAEIERLRTELEQSQGVRTSLAAEIERLQAELRGYAAESHRQLRARQAEHDKATAALRAEQRGAQQAYLAAIKAFLEASR